MPDFEALECPFCKEKDFDDVGLKIHLLGGFCDKFNYIKETMRPPKLMYLSEEEQ